MCSDQRALKVNSHKKRLYLTLGGRVVIGFWIGSTRDGGLSFGPSIQGCDLHLTVWQNKGKLRYHIKHKGIEEPTDESPIGGQKSTKMVLNRIQRMLMKRLKTYHGNRTCWTFTSARWKRIRSVLPKADTKGNLYVPLEFTFAELDMDFSKKKLWQRVRIRSLLVTEPYFGFLETRHGLRLIKPVSENHILAWPLSKADEIREYFSRVIGFDEFLEYLDQTEEGRRLSSEIKDRIEQLSNS